MESSPVFIPGELIDNDYKYTISDGIIRVITNNNCYTNYNTTYCDCYDVFINNDYMVSNSISCNYNPTNYVTSLRFTNDIFYRKDLNDILLSFFIILLFSFGIPFALITHFFKKGK